MTPKMRPALDWSNVPLLGRAEQQRTIENAIKETMKLDSPAQAILLHGGSGVGKSAVVRAVLDKYVQSCWMGSGKCDQYNTRPYGSIATAVSQVLWAIRASRDEEAISRIRQAFAIGEIKALITIIPAIEDLMEKGLLSRPSSPQSESSNNKEAMVLRFISLFKRLMLKLGTCEVPLILFLDDLQWADGSSRRLIASLVEDSHIKNLCLIGSVRDGEDTTFSLPSGCAFVSQVLTCKCLNPDDTFRLVSAVLEQRDADSKLLADVIFKRTNGNPYFVRQFIDSMIQDGLIKSANDNSGGYRWNLTTVAQKMPPSSNVVDLLLRKIMITSKATQLILMVASILGHTFSRPLVESILDSQELVMLLVGNTSVVIKGELLDKSFNDAVSIGLLEVLAKEKYMFTHDRVQQAARSLIRSGPKRGKVMATLGTLLLHHVRSKNADRWLFLTATSMIARHHTDASMTEKEIASLCLEAAKMSARRTAYPVAALFADMGIDFFPNGGWRNPDTYDLTLELHSLSAEAHRGALQLSDAKKRVADVQMNATSLQDRFRAYNVLLDTLLAEQKFEECIAEATQELIALGVNIPRNPSALQVLGKLFRIKKLMKGRRFHELDSLPLTKNEVPTQVVHLQGARRYACWSLGIENKKFIAIGALTALEMTLVHGIGPLGALSFAGCGVGLSHRRNKILDAYDCAELALKTAQRYSEVTRRKCFVHVVAWNFLLPIKRPVHEGYVALQEAHEVGMKHGDSTDATLALYAASVMGILTFEPVISYRKKLESWCSTAEDLKQQGNLEMIGVWSQFAETLAGEGHHSYVLSGSFFNIANVTQTGEKSLMIQRLSFDGHVCQMILLVLFSEYEKAEVHRQQCIHVSHDGPTTFKTVCHNFMIALNCYVLAGKASSNNERRKYVRISKMYSQVVTDFAVGQSINAKALIKFLEAERSFVKKRVTTAVDGYVEAIDLLKEGKFKLLEALAWERLGCVTMESDRKSAFENLRIALTKYREFGAAAKATDLQERLQDNLF